jgi:predicted secreted hydrolase
VSPMRRRWLARLAAVAALPLAPLAAHGDAARGVRRGRTIVFPRDHGAHPETRTEWWYATGWLGTPEAPTQGVQVTFFRSATRLAAGSASRLAPRHLLFAHAAITDVAERRHHHAQRIARWSGDPAAQPDFARLDDAGVQIHPWWLRREEAAGGVRWRAHIDTDALALELDLVRTQPVLLQGDAGFSRKGPEERQASRYYSEPQLDASARGRAGGQALQGRGRAWLDHEWSDELLHPEAVGWDWIGINLFDGSALTAFQLRRADGTALWHGGSHRPAGGAARSFADSELRFVPGRRWRSPATNASYPLEWEVSSPAGRHRVRALLDGQELAGAGSVGAVYWEGLSELLDESGRRVGLGYLEMTGYAARLRLG